jgi:twitching motility two-component system response regulator PilH
MNKKALAVDDSVTDLANMKSVLTDSGFLVVTASNGKEALEKAKAEKPGVIFLDIIMPGMDGYEACRLLAEDPATKGIPVVFVTSKGQQADKVWGQMQGAKGYVTKPYRPEDLIDQVKALN